MSKYILHTFRASETIDAVIRLLGRHNLSKAELVPLRKAFDELNGQIVPKPGMTYKIPLPFEVTDEFGSVIDTTPEILEIPEDTSTEE
jgi:hypothetical protein